MNFAEYKYRKGGPRLNLPFFINKNSLKISLEKGNECWCAF